MAQEEMASEKPLCCLHGSASGSPEADSYGADPPASTAAMSVVEATEGRSRTGGLHFDTGERCGGDGSGGDAVETARTIDSRRI